MPAVAVEPRAQTEPPGSELICDQRVRVGPAGELALAARAVAEVVEFLEPAAEQPVPLAAVSAREAE